MAAKSEQITIDYFSDILCIWAWISQRRIEELTKHFANKIDIRHQFIDIFGDVHTRIDNQWSDKGYFDGFARHVMKSAAPYESAQVSNQVWSHTRPTTSANAHLAIKAVELTYDRSTAEDFTYTLRYAFFVKAKDISDLNIIYKIIDNSELDLDKVTRSISCGEAMAALMCDYQNAKEYGIKGSPCFVMNEGRQILFGNVGYRVLETNINELLKNTRDEASWC